VLGPDGRTIYYMNGNYTKLPANMEKQIPVAWQEDNILPRMWPPVGSGRGIFAPAGTLGRTNLAGNQFELFAMGFRNCYRMTFDPNGEIFTDDSDTENEIGTPWYLPTRVIHVVSGGDYGWRSGSIRWPVGFPDSLPAVIDTGPGSPTGVLMGTGTKFPARYQHALFAADWTFGTMYAVHLIPEGASFRATKEEFFSGHPLPITDVLVNPADGAMYFTVGGRTTDSALYRVTYTGNESTAPAPYPKPTPEALLRRKLESLHTSGESATVIDEAWPSLSHSDRFIRWAARVAIERQPVGLWAKRALDEKNPQGSLEALVALARLGDKSLQPQLIDALARFDFAKLSTEQQYSVVRLWQLAFTRMGAPSPEVKRRVVTLLEPFFPHPDRLLSRDLAALLVTLDSPTLVAKLVPLLKVPEEPEPQDVVDEALAARNTRYGRFVSGANKTRPARQQISYANVLRCARVGWTPPLREEFFSWFHSAHAWSGGQSFVGFINNIRLLALADVADATERERLAKLSQRPDTQLNFGATPPKGPGKNYTLDDATAAVRGHLTGRNYEQGRAMFSAAACVACHRLGDLGIGTAAPNLTQSGSRYTERDLLQSIIEPSATINENFAATRYELRDGSALVGYPAFEEGAELLITTNLMLPNALTLVKSADVKSKGPSPTSLMPAGLVNGLNEDELRDLVAFILSGGNRNHAMFAPAKK
jgi:putative heme-binding domain-containing protein